MRVTWSGIIKGLCILVTGLGIGCLVGLSISPVVSIVITSVTGSAAAIIAAMSGLEDKSETGNTQSNRNLRWNVNPAPLTALVVGLVIGSGYGIYVRNQDLLGGSDLSAELKQWTDAGLDQEEVARRLFENRYSYRGWLGNDLSAEVQKWTNAGLTNQEEVTRRLFESTYPMNYELSTNTEKPELGQNGSVLFDVTIQNECNRIVGYAYTEQDDAKFRDIVTHSTIPRIQDLPNVITNTNSLREVLITLCEAR